MHAPKVPTLVSLLRQAAGERPDRRAFTLLGDGETETASLTYGELDRRARALAAWLQERGLAGERVLLHHPPGLGFLEAFFGCLYAGAVAVPAFPARPRKPNPRLEAIRADAGAAAVLGPEDGVPGEPEEMADAWRDPGVSGDSLAYLQYTSGSTATPKGVRILHRNVLHNLEACDRAARHSEESVGVTWLPHFHDMGLVYGLLLPLYKGFPAVVIPPVAFLQSPLRWLRAITRYGATHSGGANFAYDLCVRKTSEEDRQGLDLSRWELAYNGSEPVRAATLDRFAEAFAPHGFRRTAFYPCYGLAEATLLVAAGEKGAGPTVREGRVGVGRPALDTDIVLVDGEVLVSGPGVADGYWNRPEETAETFKSLIDGRPFLRTGDLGEVHDGVLFVTGRLKDMILVRGTNHYPQDIERTAQESHFALAPDGGAAFSVEADGEERLVIVHEVERTARHGDLGAVIGAIRQAVAGEHQLAARAVVLIRPGSLPRTTSGKVQRRACRQAFLDGTLAVLEAWEEWRAGGTDVEGSIRERLAAALGMAASEVDPDVPVTRYGLDSIAAIELAHGIERDFGVAVPLEELFEGVSLADLMRLVQRDQRPVETPQSVLPDLTGSRNVGASPTPQQPTRSANGTNTVPDTDNAPDAADPDPGGRTDSWRVREVRGDGGGRRPGVSGPGPVSEDGLGRLYGTASPGQRALWFLQQLAPEAVPFNLALAVRISPSPDVDRLRRALQGLVDRHEALRTTFPARDDEPVLVVHDGIPVAFVVEPWAPERLDREAHRPFDLQNGPLFRAHLFGDDVLLLTAHHIAVDLWSVPILLSDLGALYGGDGRGRPSPGDRERGERAEAYWRDRLAGAPFELDLPFDRPRPAAQTYRGDFVPFRLGPDLTRLAGIAGIAGVTPFVALLTAFQALLGRITGREDLVVGAPTSGRTRPALARTVGYLVNPLPLRADLSGSPRFRELLERTRRSVAADLAHQDLPFPEIVEEVQPARDPARHPLFQVMVSWQSAGPWTSLAMGEPGAVVETGGLRLESLGVRVRAAQLDLSLVAWGSGDGVAAGFERNADLFDRSTVLRLAGQLDTLIAAAARNPETPLADLPLMSPGQAHQVLREWNDTAMGFAALDGAHRRIEAWAARTPDGVAVDHEGGTVTYSELDRLADELADRLRELGAGPEVRVAIRLPRSLEQVVAMIAVAKSGAVWLVLDPGHPPERHAFILRDADVSILLSPSGLERVGGGAQSPHRGGVFPANRAAYIIYTSGSTGTPKGVAVSHANLVSYLASPELGPGTGPGDRLLFVSSPLFDVSVHDVFRTLGSGATLVVRSDVSDILGAAARERITILNITTAQWHEVSLELARLPGSVRLLLIGGEQAAADAWERWRGLDLTLLHGYGPTEATICVCYHRLGETPAVQLKVPIGRPTANTRLHVLDAAGLLVPPGVTGELWIGGPGVARGYLGRPDLTADRFRPDPFGEPGARLYRTGDLARTLADGKLEHLGRTDQQIKLRGFRIEPGEVESALLRHPGVREAVVGARRSLLVAWIAGTADPADLRRSLEGSLPPYLVPAAFVVLPEIPRTRAGKVDRQALPDPEAVSGSAAPRTPAEEALAALWTEALGLDRVGIHDDLFELGGHSLLAARIAARVRSAFGVDLPLPVLLSRPTVAGLAEWIGRARADEEPPLAPGPDGPVPLSPAQERLWFLDQLVPGSPAYNVPVAFTLEGDVDEEALGRSLDFLVERQESLRTVVAVVDGEAVQVVSPEGWRLDIVHPEDAQAWIEAEARRPFDLERGPLFRAALLRLADGGRILFLNLHHLVCDGWSMDVLLRELLRFDLPPLPVRYADFARWQRERLRTPAAQSRLEAWRERLAGVPAVLELPADRPRPASRTFEGEIRRLPMIPGLRSLARQEGATLFMALLAGFAGWLQRLTGQDDLALGTPVAGRDRVELEGLVGLFVNTLVLRLDLDGDPDVRELLRRSRETALDAYTRKDVPIEKLMDVQVVLALEEDPFRPRDLAGGLRLVPMPVHTGTAKFDLEVHLWEEGDNLGGYIAASRDLFEPATADRMAERLAVFLGGLSSGARLSELPLMPEAERRQIEAWTGPAAGFDTQPLHRRFEAWAERTPDAVAVTCEGESLTYAELNRRADRIAADLQARGVLRGDLVAIQLDRSRELIAAILGVLKAGAAYLPIDEQAPEERRRMILADAAPRLVLSVEGLRPSPPAPLPAAHPDPRERGEGSRETVTPSFAASYSGSTDGDGFEDGHAPLSRRSGGEAGRGAGGEGRRPPVLPEGTAYVIYTSGSTGKPKGVMVSHASAARLFSATEPWMGFGPDDVWTLFHSCAFDFSVWEIWGALAHGGRLVVVPYRVSRSPEAFRELLASERVTVLSQTPSAFRQLQQADREAPEPLTDLRLVVFGGEALEPATLRPWVERYGTDRPRLINMYGITETTVHVTYRPITERDLGAGRSLIGVPIPDLSLHVLDRALRPAPIGVTGELCVGGAGVARGYLGRPDLTAERFVPDPWGDGQRLYRSGDLARRREDGDLEYLGRADHQVKIRGFRIEPAEVEAALLAHPAVREAVVLARPDGSGGKRLVAFLVGDVPTGEELRRFLLGRVAEPMVPSVFVVLDRLPLTANGKVDRKALLEVSPDPQATEFVAPRTPAEQALAEVWAEVFGVERVGVHDNFFALGGDSILSVRVAGLARTRGLAVSVPQIFERQTVAELAVAVETDPHPVLLPRAGEGAPSLELPKGVADAYPLAALQAGMIYHGSRSGGALYHVVTSHHLRCRFDPAAFQAAAQAVAARHPVLRTSFDLTGFAEPVQIVHARVHVPVRVEDLRHLDSEAQEEVLDAWFEDELRHGFDLNRAPLIRFHLHRRTDDSFQLGWSEHHAILDGWSVALLISELLARYLGTWAGSIGDRPTLPYRDYVALERRTAESEEARRFWSEALADAEPSMLPRWSGPRREKPREGWSISLEVPPGVRQRSGEIPLKSRLLAVHLRVLGHLSGSRDVATGVVFNGRPEAEGGDRTLGLFLNTLPLRAVLSDTDWDGLARIALEAERAVLPWRRYPLSELRRTLGRDPFEVAFNYIHFHAFQDVLGGVEDLGGRGFQRTSFPLLVHFHQDVATPRIELRLEADPEVLTREQLESIAAVYARALAALAAGEAPESLLSEAERHQLRVEWNPPSPSFPVFLLHERFEEQAARRPDAVAVSHPEEELTYGELNRRADRLASRLRELGVGPEVPVALRLGRTPRLIVAMLAVLKAGGGYVPLDPAWPKERQEYVLEDSGATVVVSEKEGGFILDGREAPSPARQRGGGKGRGLLGAEEEDPSPTLPRFAGEGAPTLPENLVYILYTSGSTGRPKGVPLSHAAVARLFTSTAELAGFGEDDVFALFHSPAFDVSVWEMWGALLHGGRLVIVPWEVTRSPDRLLDLLRRERVTVLCQTPTAFRQLVSADTGEPTSLRWIHFAGEALDLPMLAPWIANHGDERPRLVNLYGITETTVYLTWRQVTAADLDMDGPGSIGRAFPDVPLHVVDRDLRPVPVGVPGELLVGGPCLARGYLHRPDLTAERFVPDPWGDGSRLYRSGDLARRRPDGELEYLGRIDQQVKIRGHRVEPGEIAARLEQHPAVRQAVVLPWQRAADDVRLVAYIVGHAPESELRAFLRETLPETMVPSSYIEIPALPLTASGKLDRRALPVPGQTVAETPAVRPQIGIEAAVAAVWREVLGREEVELDTSFFDLGGHSILLLRAQARLQEALGREVPMTDLFRYPTVRALAGRLGGTATEKAPQRRSAPQTRTGAIAVVGLACRFPGAADPEAFWRNLRDGVESVSVFSEDELLAAGVDPGLVRNPAYVPAAAVLEDADRFDSAFFDMTPREADLTDPQQRVFLQCAWEALESAGRAPGSPDALGDRVAVFAGSGLNTYLLSNLVPHPELAGAGLQAVVGNDKDFLATRVSYKLDLKGPSLSVQTACSTSLVAVHLACKALRDGECDTALAGGVTIRFPQTAGYLHEEGGIYSPDGRCRAFDAAAGGTVGGSGAGAVVLRRLEDALADGDPVRAVILGSAVNNDGAVKVGFTAPGVEGQSAVVADALAAARVAPETVSYIEAHGTGTALGDPIEVAALAQALGPGDQRWLGSVKTNLGHLDTAAGVAGLIKTVLALEHREIPATLHYREPNPRLDLTGFRVADRLVPWTGPGPRRAGVSSLGMGGTNAHVVLEEAPAAPSSSPSRPWQLLVLSARTEEALETAAQRLAAHLREHPELDLADVAHTLRTGRRPFRHRRAIVCHDRDFSPHGWSAEAGEPAVAFLFPGQGEQRSGMAAELVRDEPVFRTALDDGLDRLRPEMDLRPLLSGDGEALDRTLFAQPTLFLFEYALAQLWLSWGLRPAALLGHSLGEWTAACLAGVVSLDDALRIVTARARLMDACPPGAMLSVPLPEDEVRSLLGGLDLAAVNAPGRCVVSGPAEEIEDLAARLPHVSCRWLATSHAFHSRLMDAAVEPFAREVAKADLKPPRIPIVSSRTGTWMTAEQATDPGYWAAQIRQPVRFGAAAAELAREPRLLLEVGPGRALTSLARRSGGHSVASFPDPHQPAQAQLLQALGRAWAAGAPVDWTAFETGERRRKVPLPTYPFERRRHLIDPPGVQVRPEAVPIPIRAESEPLVDFLARVWREALGVDRVEPDDDYFELGGDSVIALQIAARLRDAGYEVSSAQLFETPTVAGLAAVLSLKETPEPEAPRFNPAGLDERTLSRVSALLEEIDREP